MKCQICAAETWVNYPHPCGKHLCLICAGNEDARQTARQNRFKRTLLDIIRFGMATAPIDFSPLAETLAKYADEPLAGKIRQIIGGEIIEVNNVS